MLLTGYMAQAAILISGSAPGASCTTAAGSPKGLRSAIRTSQPSPSTMCSGTSRASPKDAHQIASGAVQTEADWNFEPFTVGKDAQWPQSARLWHSPGQAGELRWQGVLQRRLQPLQSDLRERLRPGGERVLEARDPRPCRRRAGGVPDHGGDEWHEVGGGGQRPDGRARFHAGRVSHAARGQLERPADLSDSVDPPVHRVYRLPEPEDQPGLLLGCEVSGRPLPDDGGRGRTGYWWCRPWISCSPTTDGHPSAGWKWTGSR